MQFYRVVNKTYMTGIVIDILGQGYSPTSRRWGVKDSSQNQVKIEEAAKGVGCDAL